MKLGKSICLLHIYYYKFFNKHPSQEVVLNSENKPLEFHYIIVFVFQKYYLLTSVFVKQSNMNKHIEK